MRHPFLIGQAPAVLIALLLGSSTAFAIDNPDAPDFLKAFRTQAQRYESEISEKANNNRELLVADKNYRDFLDKELNKAYQALLPKLGTEQRQQLKTSQKLWLQYRDAEFVFVSGNWTPTNFGSSSALSREMYQASLVRARVEQLLGYLQNY